MRNTTINKRPEIQVLSGAPALTVNRLCGSGLQVIVSAAQALLLGDAEVAVAGGAEPMSQAERI